MLSSRWFLLPQQQNGVNLFPRYTDSAACKGVASILTDDGFVARVYAESEELLDELAALPDVEELTREQLLSTMADLGIDGDPDELYRAAEL